MKKCLENVVIPMFCSAQLISNDEQQAKLLKLLTLWESKANFFDLCVMSKLRSPTSSLQEYKTNLLSVHASVVSSITQSTKQTFENYQQQHQAFIQHATQQITLLETQKQNIEQTLNAPPPSLITSLVDQPHSQLNNQMNQRIEGANPPAPQHLTNATLTSLSGLGGASTSMGFNPYAPMSPQSLLNDFSLPPPNFQIPDLSKPPPGFAPVPVSESLEDLTPSVPYFELPAGLIVPLIRLEDYGYKPLDSTLIKLPPPTPPNERLVSAVEAFYSLPSHDHPRDGYV